jgi:hypothetical protein
MGEDEEATIRTLTAYREGIRRKVDSNTLLSTISGIFHALTFQYMV